jgi:hypothetical protein
MKIYQYQQVYKILKSDIPELDKACHFYAILKNKPYEEVENIPIKKVLDFYKKDHLGVKNKHVKPIYRIGFRFYRINLDVLYNTTSDNISVIAFCANEDALTENLHKILATMTRRTAKQRKSGAYFDKLASKIQKKVNWEVAYNLAIFFSKHYNRIKILKELTARQSKINKELSQLLKK